MLPNENDTMDSREVTRLRDEYNWILNLAATDDSGSVLDFWTRLRKFIKDGSKGDPAAISAWVDKEIRRVDKFAGMTGDQIDAALEDARPDFAPDVAREEEKFQRDIEDQARTIGVNLSAEAMAQLVDEARRNLWDTQDIKNALRSRSATALAESEDNAGFGGAIGKAAADLANWSRLNGIEIDQGSADRLISSVAFGEMTLDQVKDNLRKQYMVGAFPGWQEQINAGLDVYDLSAPYRAIAQRMLGRSDMNMSDNTLREMMQVQNADGTMGIRPLWEAEKYIRTLPEWQKSDDAYNTYANAGLEIGRMFGFR